ncbi:unnamed protein product [Amaranthus hypochondriacus]
MEKEEVTNYLKSHHAMRSAKASMLLLSFENRRHQQEKELMNQSIDDLKLELVQERFKRKYMKLCGLIEFMLLIIFIISLLSIVFLKFL